MDPLSAEQKKIIKCIIHVKDKQLRGAWETEDVCRILWWCCLTLLRVWFCQVLVNHTFWSLRRRDLDYTVGVTVLGHGQFKLRAFTQYFFVFGSRRRTHIVVYCLRTRVYGPTMDESHELMLKQSLPQIATLHVHTVLVLWLAEYLEIKWWLSKCFNSIYPIFLKFHELIPYLMELVSMIMSPLC